MTTRVPGWICGGTMVRAPFDSLAGLYDEEAVAPFMPGSVSVISRVTRGGNWIATAFSLKISPPLSPHRMQFVSVAELKPPHIGAPAPSRFSGVPL